MDMIYTDDTCAGMAIDALRRSGGDEASLAVEVTDALRRAYSDGYRAGKTKAVEIADEVKLTYDLGVSHGERDKAKEPVGA